MWRALRPVRREGGPLPALLRWPPSNAGGRSRARQSRVAPPRAEYMGTKALTAKDLGVRDLDLYVKIKRLQGVQAPDEPPPPRLCPLNLKVATPADIESAPSLPAVTAASHEFLLRRSPLHGRIAH